MTFLTDKQTQINDLLKKMRELMNEDPRCVTEIDTEKAKGVYLPEGVFKNILVPYLLISGGYIRGLKSLTRIMLLTLDIYSLILAVWILKGGRVSHIGK